KSDREKARFFLMLNVSLRSGLPLYQTLLIVRESLPYYWRDVVSFLSENLRRGYSLSQSMQTFKEIFEPVTLKLIAVGESTGKLDDICIYLFEFYENKSRVINKLVSSISYPIFIVSFAIIIAYIVLNFVFPVVIGMYDELNVKLPFMTQLLKLFMEFFSFQNLLIFFTLFVLVGGGVYLYIGKEKFMAFFLDMFSSLPIISNIYKKYVVNNFLYTFVLCIKSGLTMSDAIKFSLALLPERISKKHFSDVYKRVLEGEELSKILSNKPFFNKIIINFISSYEETAKTEIIDKLVGYLTFDINLAIDRVLILIEPLLVTGVSLFVFFIAASILVPIMGISMHFVQ
ncbi:MAG: type II secretion system F family protein, partial [Candidatus Calescibacterium sp.]|nr:type II secretion system F family protein [Candidatus Calescibacterium sp.]